MKKLLLLLAVSFGYICANAQNPFAEYGYEPKIATLSQGQFIETFDNDTIVQIGSVLYNTKSKQIVAFVQTDTIYSEATLQPDIVSRWMSPDPLADHPNLRSWSPYHFAYDNPIKYNDPDGRCPDCLWDAFNVVLGAKSFVSNVKEGNYWSAALDGVGVLVDGAALIVPVVPGGAGTAIKLVRGGDKAIDMAKGADKVNDARKSTSKGADFVVTPDGTAVPTSQSRMKEGFENAGFKKEPATKTAEKGDIYTVPSKKGDVDVRTMEGSNSHPKRAVFTESGTNNPVKVGGEKFKNNEPKQVRREQSHLPQKD